MLPYKFFCPILLGAVLASLTGARLIADAAADENHAHHSHGGGDLLLFPAMQATHRSKPIHSRPQDSLDPEIDIFYSADLERLRFLAEFLVRKDEQEMERLQVGWLVQPNTSLWAGRFHSPLGFWNSEHHHGAFLQTAISRPSILAFEDEAGALPTHILGLLLEGSAEQSHGDLNYAFGIGQGPTLAEELEPLDILNPNGRGKLTAGGRLSYRSAEGDHEIGVSAGHSRIPLDRGLPYDTNEQNVANVFYHLETDRLRIVGELFLVNNRLETGGSARHDRFTAAYAQPEYKVNGAWTAFGRIETSRNAGGNAFLNLLPEFVTSRLIAGFRHELDKSQAIKFELSHNSRQDSAHYNQLSLQWSMVYP